MNHKPKRVGSSTVSLQIPVQVLAEIEMRAALAQKDRDAYLIDLALADVSFGAATQTKQNGVIVMDKGGLIRWVNISFCAMCGYTLGDVLGKEWVSLLRGPATDASYLEGFNKALKRKRKHLGPVLNYHRSGQPYWVCRLIAPISSSGIHLGFVALERQIATPETLGPDGGRLARELEAQLPRVQKVICINPEKFGMAI